MARVINTPITSLDQSWEYQSGETVENFLKGELAKRAGYLYRTTQKLGDYYYIYGFTDIDAFYAWQDDEDPSHILFRVQLPNLENDTFSVNLETNSNTSKLVDFGDGVKINLRYTSTSTNPITGVRTDTYNDGTLIIMRAANGSGYVEVARLPISPHEYETPGYTTFDITSYLVDGDNSLRIRVEDNVNGSVSNNITFRSVIKTTLSLRNATSTTDLLTSLMFRYYISGNVDKTLHLILSDQAGHSDEFSFSIGDRTYIETPYSTPVITSPSLQSGVIDVVAWITVDDTTLKTDRIRNQFYYSTASSNTPVILLNNKNVSVQNYTNAKLFDYVLYNKSTSVNIQVSIGGKIVVNQTINNVVTNVSNSFYWTFEYESIDTMLDAVVTVTPDGGESQIFSLVVDNSQNFNPTIGADFVLNPKTRNNTEENPATIINDVNGNIVGSTFEGVTFGSNGWVNDDTGVAVLRVNNGGKITIDYDCLDHAFTGTTIELDYKVRNVFGENEDILRICDTLENGNILGFVMKPFEGAFFTQNNQLKRDQDYMFGENERIHLAINIIPNVSDSGVNYVRLFVNGILNREFVYQQSDVFRTKKTSIEIGSKNNDIDIYGIRVYKKALSAFDVRKDYMSTIPTMVEKIAYKTANDILGGDDTISYDKAKVKYNCLCWTGKHPEYKTGNVKFTGDLEINIVGDPEHSGKINNMKISGQGSSSRGYWKWNHGYKMNKDSVWVDGNGVERGKFYQLQDGVPNAVSLVGKRNWASSMQSHKMGATALYNDLWKAIVKNNGITNTPGYEDTRVAVVQKPFLYFIRETENDQYVFDGFMTFGPAKFDEPTFVGEINQFPDLLCLEGSDNGRPLTLCQVPWIDSEVTYNEDEEYYEYNGQGSWDYGMGNHTSINYFRDAFNFVYTHSLRLKPIDSLNTLNTTSGIDRTYQYWDTTNGNVYRFDYITSKFVNAGTSKNGNVYSTLNIFNQTGISKTGNNEADTKAFINWRANHFKANANLYFEIDDTLFSMCFVKMIAASDNWCKNIYLYIDPVSHKIRFWQDDLDTIFQTDNVGRKTKPYYVEEHDKNGSTHYFNSDDSVLFTLFEQAFETDMRAMMNRVLNTMSSTEFGGSTDACMHKYFFSTQKYFPAVAYNETARLLYEEAQVMTVTPKPGGGFMYTNGTPPISQSLGDQYSAEKMFWDRRSVYLKSWASVPPFYVRSEGSQQYRSIANVDGSQAAYSFKLTPYLWLYPKTGYGQTPMADNVRVPAGTEYTTLELNPANDEDTFIYGQDYYTSFGEFGMVSLGEAFNLAGSHLTEFSADSRKVDVMQFRPTAMTINCPALKSLVLHGVSTLAGSLDLKNAPKLEVLDARGTKLSSIVLPKSDKLNEVYLPAVNSINIDGANVDKFEIDSYENLNTFSWTNGKGKFWNNNLGSFISRWVQAVSPVGKSITLTGLESTMELEDVIALGAFTNKNIQGRIIVNEDINMDEYNRIVEVWGEEVFDPNNSLVIDALSGSVINGPADVNQGNTATYKAILFPLGTQKITYKMYVNGAHVTSNTYKTITLNPNTGELRIGSLDADYEIFITGYDGVKETAKKRVICSTEHKTTAFTWDISGCYGLSGNNMISIYTEADNGNRSLISLTATDQLSTSVVSSVNFKIVDSLGQEWPIANAYQSGSRIIYLQHGPSMYGNVFTESATPTGERVKFKYVAEVNFSDGTNTVTTESDWLYIWKQIDVVYAPTTVTKTLYKGEERIYEFRYSPEDATEKKCHIDSITVASNQGADSGNPSIVTTIVSDENGNHTGFKVEYVGEDALISTTINVDVHPTGYNAEIRTYNFSIPITVGLPTYETLVNIGSNQQTPFYIVDSPDIVSVEDMVGNILTVAKETNLTVNDGTTHKGRIYSWSGSNSNHNHEYRDGIWIKIKHVRPIHRMFIKGSEEGTNYTPVDVLFDDLITELADNTFDYVPTGTWYKSNLKSIHFPNVLKRIGNYAIPFTFTVDLTNTKVETIGDYNFNSLDSTSGGAKLDIKFPETLKNIGKYCCRPYNNYNYSIDLSRCTQLESIGASFGSNGPDNKADLLSFPPTWKVDTINDNSFKYLNNVKELNNITVLRSVKTFKNYAFSNCSITQVVLPLLEGECAWENLYDLCFRIGRSDGEYVLDFSKCRNIKKFERAFSGDNIPAITIKNLDLSKCVNDTNFSSVSFFSYDSENFNYKLGSGIVYPKGGQRVSYENIMFTDDSPVIDLVGENISSEAYVIFNKVKNVPGLRVWSYISPSLLNESFAMWNPNAEIYIKTNASNIEMPSITPTYGNEGLPKNITFECVSTGNEMHSACTGLYTIKTSDENKTIYCLSLPHTPNIKLELAGKFSSVNLDNSKTITAINNLSINCKALTTSDNVSNSAKVYGDSSVKLLGNDALYGVDTKYNAKWCIAAALPNLETLSINLDNDNVDKTIIVPASLKVLKYRTNQIHNVEFLTGIVSKFEPTSEWLEDNNLDMSNGWVIYNTYNKNKLDEIALNGWSTSGSVYVTSPVNSNCFDNLRINGWNGGLELLHKLDTLKVDNAKFDLYLSSADEFIVPYLNSINVVNGENASGVKTLYKNENHDLYSGGVHLKIDVSKPNQFNNVDLRNFGVGRQVDEIYFEDTNTNHVPADNMFNDCAFPDRIINYKISYTGESKQNNIFNRCSGHLVILLIDNQKLGNNCCCSQNLSFSCGLYKLMQIGYNCFSNAKRKPSEVLGTGAKIGKNAFNNLSASAGANIEFPNVDADIDGFMYNCPNVTSVSGVTLHYSGTSNLDWVRGPFKNCTNLTTIGSATYPLKLYSNYINMESSSLIDARKRWFENSNNINLIYMDEPNGQSNTITKMSIRRSFVNADVLPQNGTAHIPDIASLDSTSLLNYLSGWRGWTLVRDINL